MIATVLLSILAHGVSANTYIKLYATRIADLRPETPVFVNCLRYIFARSGGHCRKLPHLAQPIV
jgi:hypothetical protein